VNGTGGINHTGTGLFKIDAGGNVELASATGTAIKLSSGGSGTALAVTGGASIDTISGNPSFSGGASVTSGQTLVMTGATLSGGPSLSDGATITTGKTLVMTGATLSGGPTLSGGATVTSGQTLGLNGVTVSGNPTFSGRPVIKQTIWTTQLKLRAKMTQVWGPITQLPFEQVDSADDIPFLMANYFESVYDSFTVSDFYVDKSSVLSGTIGGVYYMRFRPVQQMGTTTLTFTSTFASFAVNLLPGPFVSSGIMETTFYLPPNWKLTATTTALSANDTNIIPIWDFTLALLS
jgi:hypothetical protein